MARFKKSGKVEKQNQNNGKMKLKYDRSPKSRLIP